MGDQVISKISDES